MRFHQTVCDHGQQLIENGIDLSLLLDKVDEYGKMQALDIARAAGVQLAMGAKAGMRLNRGRALDFMLPQEGKDIVNEKAVWAACIAIQVDRDLECRSGFEHPSNLQGQVLSSAQVQ